MPVLQFESTHNKEMTQWQEMFRSIPMTHRKVEAG